MASPTAAAATAIDAEPSPAKLITLEDGATAATRESPGPKYHERGLLRGLEILTAFTIQQPALDLSTLSDRLHLPKGTLVRLLDCLQYAGFLELEPGTGRYRLGAKAFEVGCVYQQTASLRLMALPVLEQLAARIGHSTKIGVLDGGQALHLAVVLAPRLLRYNAYIGLRSDVHCSAIGKVLLAELPAGERDELLGRLRLARYTPRTVTDPAALRAALAEVRARGYAMDDEESMPGLRCVGAAVRAPNGAAVAAVSASGPKAEFEADTLRGIVAAVTEAAGEIGHRLGPAAALPDGWRRLP